MTIAKRCRGRDKGNNTRPQDSPNQQPPCPCNNTEATDSSSWDRPPNRAGTRPTASSQGARPRRTTSRHTQAQASAKSKPTTPQLAINVHIDDICTSVVAEREDVVVRRLMAGAKDILELVEGEFGVYGFRTQGCSSSLLLATTETADPRAGQAGGRTWPPQRQIWGSTQRGA